MPDSFLSRGSCLTTKLQQALLPIKSHLSDAQTALLWQTFATAYELHDGQKRKSGEAFLTHPVSVMAILAEWQMDVPTLAAALLHDVVEDTEATVADITALFGPDVACLVDGVTKAERAEAFGSVANMHKFQAAARQDVRVGYLKLADRLDNMRTLWALPESKRLLIAEETLRFFLPLAQQYHLECQHELEQLTFRFLAVNRA